MRLITHNLLACPAKNCCDPYPLLISDAELSERETDYNPEFLKRIIPRLHWDALVTTAYSLGIDTLPKQLPEEKDMDDEFFKALHHVLLEVRITQGRMTCNGCGHIYPIKDAIPNMLLQEHEV